MPKRAAFMATLAGAAALLSAPLAPVSADDSVLDSAPDVQPGTAMAGSPFLDDRPQALNGLRTRFTTGYVGSKNVSGVIEVQLPYLYLNGALCANNPKVNVTNLPDYRMLFTGFVSCFSPVSDATVAVYLDELGLRLNVVRPYSPANGCFSFFGCPYPEVLYRWE